jgi:TRAP-type mannitol/chloroaromatic compound transport system substrate-binding protein
MKRRHFVRTLPLAAAGAATAACARREPGAPGSATARGETLRWKLATTWPPNFPGLGTGANFLAQTIERCSGGRIEVKVYGAGELVPAFEVFDAVARGTCELGHSGAYYWKGKTESASLFSALPFGMTANEVNAWLWFGGGMELWREAYAPFGIVPMPCGNSGCQMGGWFREPINGIADLRGLKMRMPGIGGEVLARAGATPVTLPGAEIFTAMQTGNIDATEWVGPYNDLAFGLHKVAKYYYYPGWHEPGSILECLINRAAFEALPDDLKAVVETACRAVNDSMLAEFNARNHESLATLVREHGVELRRFPDDVLRLLRELSVTVADEKAAADPSFARILASYRTFAAGVAQWTRVSDQALLDTRLL